MLQRTASPAPKNGAYTGKNRLLSVTTPLGADSLLLTEFTGHEGISQLFQFRLELLAENGREIPFDRLLGQPVTVRLSLPGGGHRCFHGLVSRCSEGGRDVHFTRYQAEVVPQFWLWTRRVQSRIFQHVSVPEILKQVLAGLDVEFQLAGPFHPRDYCVQYRESDFAFASRLLEEEGLYYFFKHRADGHTLVLANSPHCHPDLPAGPALEFDEVEGGNRPEGRVFSWEKRQELRSGKVSLRDHCFELPHLPLQADRGIQDTVPVGRVTHKLRVAPNERLEIYDWPGGYAGRYDGIGRGGAEQPDELKQIFEDNQRTAGIRMQQEALPGLSIRGASTCRHLVSGHKFTLARHFNADGAYVLTQVEHAASQGADYRSGGRHATGASLTYENRFTCIPIALPFRPPRVTPRPRVEGTQTAVVVGPRSEEIFTDKYGRVKVQFHWDRDGKHDADSSCWIRVGTPWAGKGWGMMHIPRVGQEVIVDFLEGDPDQPLIIGSVFNADQMPAYPLPQEKTKSYVKSNSSPGGKGFNELRFEDKAHHEQVFLHAQRDLDLRVRHDCKERVGHDRHLIVGWEKDGQRGGDQVELVQQDKHLTVRRDQIEHVAGNISLTVGRGEVADGGRLQVIIDKKKSELVGKEGYDLHVEGSYLAKVDDTVAFTVKNYFAIKTGGHEVEAADVVFKADTIHLEGGSIVLKSGPSVIHVTEKGIKIEGPLVDINCGHAVSSEEIGRLPVPLDPTPSPPAVPARADDARSGHKSTPY